MGSTTGHGRLCGWIVEANLCWECQENQSEWLDEQLALQAGEES